MECFKHFLFIFVPKTTKNMANNFFELNYDSVYIAKAIRHSAKIQGMQVNMTQINKLLYILYGTVLVAKSQRITYEHPCAWPYGPVFPRVHKHIKLSDEICDTEYNKLKEENPYIVSTMDDIVKVFGKIPAGQLSAWSHEDGSPWELAVRRSKGKWNTQLDDEDIYAYFFSYVKKSA